VRIPPSVPPSYNIAPTDVQPVVRLAQKYRGTRTGADAMGSVAVVARDAKLGSFTVKQRK
jgi:hypothetical protein